MLLSGKRGPICSFCLTKINAGIKIIKKKNIIISRFHVIMYRRNACSSFLYTTKQQWMNWHQLVSCSTCLVSVKGELRVTVQVTAVVTAFENLACENLYYMMTHLDLGQFIFFFSWIWCQMWKKTTKSLTCLTRDQSDVHLCCQLLSNCLTTWTPVILQIRLPMSTKQNHEFCLKVTYTFPMKNSSVAQQVMRLFF